jgi:hypothetical protein
MHGHTYVKGQIVFDLYCSVRSKTVDPKIGKINEILNGAPIL